MTMWRVKAIGARSGAEYTYTVDAPTDAQEMYVVMSAYAEHGERFRAGVVPEKLAPGGTAERAN